MPCCSPLSNSSPMLLLSTGGDGLMRVWLVGSVGKLVCTMQAAQVGHRGVAPCFVPSSIWALCLSVSSPCSHCSVMK